MFVGGTTLLTETYRPEEQSRVQAFNEFMVFGTTAVTSLASGAVFITHGWQWVNLGTVVPVVLATPAALWLSRRRRAAVSALPACRRGLPGGPPGGPDRQGGEW